MIHLISDKLVELVEKHSDEIVKRWVARLLSDPTTSSFSRSHLPFVEKKAKEILKNLGRWVSYDTSKEEVGRSYAEDGMALFKLQIPLCETYRAMYTLRRILWLFVETESAFDSPMELNQMRELSNRVILFFDRAEYYMIRGYMEEMNRRMMELCKLSSEDAGKIFFDNSFYNK